MSYSTCICTRTCMSTVQEIHAFTSNVVQYPTYIRLRRNEDFGNHELCHAQISMHHVSLAPCTGNIRNESLVPQQQTYCNY